MKKAPFALTTLAALTVAASALAQDPAGAGPPPPLDANAPARSATPPTSAAPPPGNGVAPALSPGEEAQRTTITGAEVTPSPPATPPPRETITVRQSYRPNRSLLYAGGATLIASYAATAAVTRLQNLKDGDGHEPAYIPIAGPWLQLANMPKMTVVDQIGLGASGVAQGAGLVLGILSFIIPEKVPVATIEAGGARVNVGAASFGMGSAGLGAVGEF
jgi:hypothetical protein